MRGEKGISQLAPGAVSEAFRRCNDVGSMVWF